MIISVDEYGDFDVYLGDDGTLDTVIEVSHTQTRTEEIRFSTEHAAFYRDDTGAMTDEGFDELAQEAVESYIEQYLL